MTRLGAFLLLPLAITPTLRSAPLVEVSVEGAEAPPSLALRPGEPYRAEEVSLEVRRLWRTGRYADISVTADAQAEGVRLNLRLTPHTLYELRRIRVRPYDEELARRLRQASPLSLHQIRQAMNEIRAGLIAGGYRDARATAELDPWEGGRADLTVTIERGQPWRVTSVEWQAPADAPTESWQRELVSLRRRTFFPGLPPLWRAWRSKAVYREEGLRADLARLEARLLAEGRLDARVAASSSFSEEGRAEVRVAVQPGPQYRFSRIDAPDGLQLEPRRQPDWRERLCGCALAAQRQADRNGRLDFAARLDFERTGGDLARGRLSFEPGPSYEVGRIEFHGLHDVEERPLRRALHLDEAETLDLERLHRSLGRLNRHPALEPVTSADVRIERHGEEPLADVIFDLRERPRGRWSLSGPLGPMNSFGGLSFRIESRLPGWGQGLWRLSAFAVSASVFSWEQPLVTALGWDRKTAWTPLVAIRRPLTPGRFWTSGWSYAPQLGWRGSLALAAMERARALGAPLLAAGNGTEETEISVFGAADGEQQRRGSLYCRRHRGFWSHSRAVLSRVLAMAGM